jgi:hypothetical protein
MRNFRDCLGKCMMLATCQIQNLWCGGRYGISLCHHSEKLDIITIIPAIHSTYSRIHRYAVTVTQVHWKDSWESNHNWGWQLHSSLWGYYLFLQILFGDTNSLSSCWWVCFARCILLHLVSSHYAATQTKYQGMTVRRCCIMYQKWLKLNRVKVLY